MTETDLDRRIAAVRQFNRAYTQRIGVLDEGFLDTPFSLTQGRVLYELAEDDGVTAKDIADKLALDPGYLSRMLRAFQQSGLVESRRGAADGRRKALSLTAAGRAAFAPLDRNAKTGIARMLAPLTPARQEALTGSMGRITALLDPTAEAPIELRPHRAGDIGWIVERHGAVYAAEYGWNAGFEAMVAEIGAVLLHNFDPSREGCWIAERDGERLGSIALARHGDEVAQLRLLLVEPAARGHGLGARLVDECLAFARGAGYREIMLETYSILTAARRIYAAAGFRLAEEHAEQAYGHDLTGETWQMALPS
jgi:DNA-binding MarR family transcriptional regulator/GNAT superfamily N-acetyltransferase